MTNEQNIKAILQCFFSGYKDEIIDAAAKRILEIEPVRRGKWIGVNPMVDTLECSMCGWNILGEEFVTDYCPCCGAKMEEDDGAFV